MSATTIVGQIVDTLTDAITNLTEIVVQKKQENAEVPPTLPQIVEAVCGAADTLVQVANQLAHSDYDEYPEIQKDILAASNDVSVSNNRLRNSVRELVATSNRQRGWENLADSCGIIAKKTILLLEIVYGAEVRKAFLTAEKARKGARDLARGLDDVKDDPQAFADLASATSGDINQLGEYVKDAGTIQQAPSAKKAFNDNANQLQNLANKMINDANAVLASPDDPRKQQLRDDVDDLNDLIAKSTAPLKPPTGSPRDKGNAVKELKDLMKQLPAAAQRVKNNPDDPKARKDLDDLLDRLEDLVHKLDDAAGQNPEIARLRDQALDAIEKLRPPKDGKSGPDQKEAEKAAKELKDLLNQLPAVAQRYKDNPNDPKARADLDKLLDRMEDLINKINDNSDGSNPEVERVRDQALAALEKFRPGAGNRLNNGTKDPKKADRAAKEINDLLKDLPGIANRVKANPNDPAAKRDLENLLDKLEDLIDRINDNSDGSNPEVEKARQAAANILAKLRPGKKTGDWQKNLLDAANDLAGTLAQLIAEAQGAKKPQAKGDINKILGELDALDAQNKRQATQVAGTLGDVARDLDSQTKKNKLAQKDPNDPIIKSFDTLSGAFSELAEASASGNGPKIIEAAKKISEELKKLKTQVAQLAAKCRNPAEQERLYAQSNALQNFSVQLKILASVKASSAKGDVGNDEHLVSVTKNMGQILSQTLVSATAAKLQSV